MMTRKILWIVLVIVMVCLNWFKQLGAQDLSSLGEEERKALLQRLAGQTGRVEPAESYQSADIYDDSTLTTRHPGRLRCIEQSARAVRLFGVQNSVGRL